MFQISVLVNNGMLNVMRFGKIWYQPQLSYILKYKANKNYYHHPKKRIIF